MPNGIFNGDYPRPTWDKPYQGLVGTDGQPISSRGTATDRFANQFGIRRGPEIIPRGPESGFALPQVLTFSSILGSAYRNYYHGQYDEAMRFSREDALAMRNDAYIRALVDERKLAVASLKWHLEVDNPKDPWQKAVRDGLTKLLRMIPRWSDLTWSGLEALWYGRAGDQLVPKFKSVKLPALPKTASGGGLPTISMAAGEGEEEAREALCYVNHLPIEGDKIDYDYDGNPYILITPWSANRLIDEGADVRILRDGGKWEAAERLSETELWPLIKARHAEFGYTTIGGRALYLKGTWRDRFRIHTHEALDASFWQPWKASAIHGVGIRSVIFWYWWLRQEFLANVTDWCARTGLGVRIWYYESGNAASEQAVDQAARDQTQQVNIKVPYTPGEQRPTLDFQETSGTGADLLLRIVKHVEDYLERYIVGQSISSGGGDDFPGWGDKGRSKMAGNTKFQITKRDAGKFADTNTDQILALMKKWTYPDLEDEFPVRQVYDVDDPEVEGWVKGAKDFVDMGGKIVADEARSRLGLSAPRPGDETVGGMEQLQAQQATSGHVKPPDGLSPNGQANGSAPPQEKPAAAQDQPPDSESAKWRMQEEECKHFYSGGAQLFVHEQLAEDYPADALADWMDEVEWSGPHRVDLDDIDFSNSDTWRASKEPEKVAKFAKRIKRGKMKPVILIKKPGEDKHIVADGHHRTLAFRHLKRPVMAWVGATPRKKGPWDNLHNEQFHGHGKSETDDQGGEKPIIDKAKLKAADFITLPENQTGTNCGNCRFNKKNVCQHPKLTGQTVNDRNCCAFWDNPDALRDWKYGEGHVLPTAHGHIIDPKSGEKATGFVGIGEHGGSHERSKAGHQVAAQGGEYRSGPVGSGKLKDGKEVQFVPHPNMSLDESTAMVDPRMLDAAWSKDSMYIKPGGGGHETPGRRKGVEQFLGSGQPVQAPRITVDDNGTVAFTDGRHRFSVLRDMGIDRIAVTLPKADLEKLGNAQKEANPALGDLPHPDELAKTPLVAPAAGAAQAAAAPQKSEQDMEALKQKATAAYPKFQMIGRKFAKTIGRSDIDADDLAQEGFTAVLEALPKYDATKGEFDGWAYQVARRHVLDVLKKKGVNLKQFGPDFDPNQVQEQPHLDVEALVAQLPELQRRVMERKMAGATDDAIAQEQNTSRSTVTRMIQDATSQLRGMMQPASAYANELEQLRYLCPDEPDRYADGRSGEYRRHHGKSVEHAIDRLHALAARADDATEDEIEGTVAGIAKQFTVEELREVAKEFGAGGSTKGQMIERIIAKLLSERDEKPKEKPAAPVQYQTPMVETMEKLTTELVRAKEDALELERQEAKQRLELEKADHYRREKDKDEQIAKLSKQAPGIDIQALATAMAAAIAVALKEMPAPVVEVKMPEPKEKTITIKKDKDGTFTAKTKED